MAKSLLTRHRRVAASGPPACSPGLLMQSALAIELTA